MDLLAFIYAEIEEAIEPEQTECWQNKRNRVIVTLKELEPDKPDDGTTGFLAYNVPNKPRMKMKTGRFLTRKLGLNSGFLDDVQIRKISDAVNMKLFPDIETRLDSGEQITQNYEDAVGGSSCMTGSDAQYTLLYESNPDRFQQLIMFYNGNSARAIVHKLDNGRFLMDRIYSDSEHLKDKMFDYAREHDWIYRTYTSAGSYNVSNGMSSECIVSGLNYEDGEVPYMDTLIKYCIERGQLTIFHRNVNKSADGTLDSTCGNLSESGYTCCCCNDRVHEDDIYCNDNGNHYCLDCYHEYYFYCEHCNNDCSVDDQVYITDKCFHVCQYCADSHYYQCQECEKYFSLDATYTVDEDELCCENCIDNYSQCESCGEYFSTIDDDGYCENCQDDKPAKNLPFVACKESDTGELFNG